MDFGLHPHASSFPLVDEAAAEPRWPLVVIVCDVCLLVQLSGELPGEPAFDGAPPWTMAQSLEIQARDLVQAVLARLAGQTKDRMILEVASHGNFLQVLFREAGYESVILEAPGPVATAARSGGHDIVVGDLASPDQIHDLVGRVAVLVDHYALAHHPAPGDAVAGMASLLSPGGVAVLEFDSLLPSLGKGEFDGFRHGHFSYLSLLSLNSMLVRHGLVPFEATTHPVYGGVLRVFVRRADDGVPPGPSVASVLAAERRAGMDDIATYRRFESAVARTCEGLRRLIDSERSAGGRVAAYGAPSRGNTLLNACDIDTDRLEFTVDRSSWKQGRLLPGSHLPIRPPAALQEGISLAVILTWDIAEEIADLLAEQAGPPLRTAVPFPEVKVLPRRSENADQVR